MTIARRAAPPRHAPATHARAARWCPGVAPCRMPVILTSIHPAHLSMSRRDPRAARSCARPLAAWLSQGTIAFTGVDGARVALLPLVDRRAGVVAALAAGGGRSRAWRAARRSRRCGCSALLGAAVAPAVAARGVPRCGPAAARLLVWARDRARRSRLSVPACRVAAIRSSAAAGGGRSWRARSSRSPHGRSSPSMPGGDEPHYLIITQSLLKDRRPPDREQPPERRLPRVLRRRPAAGLPPPRPRRRDLLDPRAGRCRCSSRRRSRIAGYRGVVRVPDPARGGRQRRSRGISPGASPARATPRGSAGPPSRCRRRRIFHSFTVYPDGPGAVVVLTGVWALLRAQQEARRAGTERTRSVVAARRGARDAAVDAHAVCAHRRAPRRRWSCCGWRDARTPRAKAVAFLAVPAVSALGWIGFFIAIYGTPDPSAPFGNEARSLALHPRRLGRPALRPALRPARVRAGARRSRSPGSA